MAIPAEPGSGSSQEITRAWDLELPFKMFGEVDAWRIKTVLVGLLALAASAGKPLCLVFFVLASL